jgi:hypothetical protein
LEEENSSTTPFVFFSPSGLNYTLRHGKNFIIGKNRPLIALGPTTRDAILKIDGVNRNNVFQCDTPSPEGLVKCLLQLITVSKDNLSM